MTPLARIRLWWNMNVRYRARMWQWANRDIVAISKEVVGGGWTVQTKRGYFTYPTLDRTIYESYVSH